MSLYERLIGNDINITKIAIWSLMNDFWQLQEGIIDYQTLASRHDLSQEESVELSTLFSSIMTKNNNDRDKARWDAWQLLVGIERGTLTQAQVYTYLGIE